jgi:hypothetical protein
MILVDLAASIYLNKVHISDNAIVLVLFYE